MTLRTAVALFVLAGISLPAPDAVAGQKYGVTVTPEKGVDYTTFKTYSWTDGWPALEKTVDGYVKAALNRELGGVGLKQSTAGPGDVLITYYTVRRTDIDAKAKQPPPGVPEAQLEVGTLVVVFMEPGSRRRLLTMRTDKPVDLDPSKREAIVNEAVTELFTKYPTRTKR